MIPLYSLQGERSEPVQRINQNLYLYLYLYLDDEIKKLKIKLKIKIKNIPHIIALLFLQILDIVSVVFLHLCVFH